MGHPVVIPESPSVLVASRSVSLQVSFSSNDSNISGCNSPSGSVISGSDEKNVQKSSPLLSKSVNLQVSISSGNDSSFENDEDFSQNENKENIASSEKDDSGHVQ